MNSSATIKESIENTVTMLGQEIGTVADAVEELNNTKARIDSLQRGMVSGTKFADKVANGDLSKFGIKDHERKLRKLLMILLLP